MIIFFEVICNPGAFGIKVGKAFPTFKLVRSGNSAVYIILILAYTLHGFFVDGP